jgi:NAD-dependent SIR2 family protein deacetylase
MSSDAALATKAAEVILQADCIVIAAGAGMGVDSGLPDFRGTEGFWRAYPALRAAGLDFISVASPRTFRDDPALAWGFYGHRLALYRATQPHAGFAIVKSWADQALHGGFVFTSNVDGQFQKAGFEDRQLEECHGSLHHLQCSRPCSKAIWSADAVVPRIDIEHCRWEGELPRCPHCGAVARPNVLMFGDFEWLEQRSDAQRVRRDAWLADVERPVVIEMGAGVDIPSVRHFGHALVRGKGARLIRLNPRECAVPSSMDVGWAVGALAGLQQIQQEVDRLR